MFGFFGYEHVRFNYVVADTEGILVYRLFRKKDNILMRRLVAFQDTINLGMIGGLIGYDQEDPKIFAVEAVHMWASAVA